MYFNSIKVRLKHLLQIANWLLRSYFNSIKVRLKPFTDLTFTMFDHFNSIKVRLKHKDFKDERVKSLLFQFHKGTIKTLDVQERCTIYSISIP